MKLLFCPNCHDVLGLLGKEWRRCICGASGGQYNKDLMTATLGGIARVFGVGNPFFNELWPILTAEQKKPLREKWYNHNDGDCWWGECVGDVQIFRIESANGPRLKVELKLLTNGTQIVTIVDKRSYTVDGKLDIKTVTVPSNPIPFKRQTLKRNKAAVK
jgi:hypothetical protein